MVVQGGAAAVGAFGRRNAIVPGRQRAQKAPGAAASRSARTIHPLSVADLQRRQNGGGVATERLGGGDSSPMADSVASSRRSSNEVSIRDFLKVSKISMAMMQKQLYETAHRGAGAAAGGVHASTTTSAVGRSQAHSAASAGSCNSSNSGLQGGVGPLAIVDHKLGHDEL